MAIQIIIHGIFDFGVGNPDHPQRYALRYSQGIPPLNPNVWDGLEISADSLDEFRVFGEQAEEQIAGGLGVSFALAPYIKTDPTFKTLSSSENRSFTLDLTAPAIALKNEVLSVETNPGKPVISVSVGDIE